MSEGRRSLPAGWQSIKKQETFHSATRCLP